MKNFLFISNIILLMGCFNNNIVSLPQSVRESSVKKLLINEYLSSNDTVIIGANKYLIKEAWTTDKFISDKSTTPNKSQIYFVIRLVNMKGNKEGLDINEEINYPKYIDYKGTAGNIIGINSNKLVIFFDSIGSSQRNLDSIKLVLKNVSLDISNNLYFVKNN